MRYLLRTKQRARYRVGVVSFFATRQQALEWLDDYAAEHPLAALREDYAEYCSAHRIDAMALAEPAAALVYAFEHLTPERREWCAREAQVRNMATYVPDRLAKERLIALRSVLNQLIPTQQQPKPEPTPERRRAPAGRMSYGRSCASETRAWIIRCDVCGSEFRARRADARFCTPRCRQKASRGRRMGSPGDDGAPAGTTVPRLSVTAP